MWWCHWRWPLRWWWRWWGGCPCWLVAVWLLGFVTMRHGVLALYSQLTVHRGMVHSVPYMAVLALLVVLLAHHGFGQTALASWFLGLFVWFGALVHLLLDELRQRRAVDFAGRRFDGRRVGGLGAAEAAKLLLLVAFMSVVTIVVASVGVNRLQMLAENLFVIDKLGEQFAGRGFADRPRIERVGFPLRRTGFHVIGGALTQICQGRPVIHPVVGAQGTQIPVAGVDLDGFHKKKIRRVARKTGHSAERKN